MLIPLSFCQKKIHTDAQKYMYLSIDSHSTVKFCTGVAHEKSILHTKQSYQICTDIVDNDVSMSKSEHFPRRALNFKRSYPSSLLKKYGKDW